jgi:hypothetical protein
LLLKIERNFFFKVSTLEINLTGHKLFYFENSTF